MQNLGFETKAIHGQLPKKDVHNAIRHPIYSGAAYYFETAEDLEDAFAYRKPSHTYSRVTNPTVEAFEKKMNTLEDGRGAVATSSGMAALSSVFMTILEKGDNIVASNYLFGNTYSFLKQTVKHFGIESRFVDSDNPDQVRNAFDKKTRALFFETISNPKMNVPDIKQLTEIAHEKGAAVIVDSTLTTPYLFFGKELGIDVIVHSTTKLISGGGTSVGGVIVDLGNCDWASCPSLERYKKFGKMSFIVRLRKELYRNMGVCMAPHTAYLHSLGLETLSLRVEKVCENAMKLALFLKNHKKIKSIHYPGLEGSPYHELAKNQFNNRFGGVLSFELSDKRECFSFLNNLKIIKRATNLGDNTSLIIHPASTIFREYSIDERKTLGVTDGLIRLSVGIETFADLRDDILKALETI